MDEPNGHEYSPHLTLRLASRSVALALLLLAAGQLLAATPDRPNVLFILTDDLGWGDVGVLYQNSRHLAMDRHQPAFATPQLDTMAAEGIQLRRHYTAAPVCAPARASLLLGVHQGHANVRDNQFDKALENNHTLASVLHQAGYATAAFGKWGLQGRGPIPEAHPQYRGFDYFFGYLTHLNGHHHYPKESGQAVWDGFSTNLTSQLDKCYTPDLWTARAKQWIIDHSATNAAQPFFIYLAYDSPHAQLQVPTMAYPPGGGRHGGVQWTGRPGAMITTATGTIDSWIHPDYTNATWDHDRNAATPEVPWPAAEKRHATMVRRIDDLTADLLQLLRDLRLATNTLVVFTSDNGPHNEGGEGGKFVQDPNFFRSYGPLDGIKRDSWEGGLRVPTFAWWPGHIPAGSISDTPSQFQDWMPTFAELAGIPAPARTDGVSLVPTLTGHGGQRESTIYVEYDFPGRTPAYDQFEPAHRGAERHLEQAIYLDGYKGVRYNVQSNAQPFLIYETLHDPKEITNLAAAGPDFARLQQRMQERVLQVRRADDEAPRPFDHDPIPPANVAQLEPGLNYRQFAGPFPWVPDFASRPAVAQGICAGLAPVEPARREGGGCEFAGYLRVPASGTYTLYLTVAGRALLRLHDAVLIDADFNYKPSSELSAQVCLQTGAHPLRLSCVPSPGVVAPLNFQWSGPGIPKQPVPLTLFQQVHR